MDYKSRLEKLRAGMAEHDLDTLFVSTPENRRYLSGFSGSAGYLFVTHDAQALATDFRYIEQAGRQAPDYRVVRTTAELKGWLPSLLSELKSRRVGFEAQNLTYASYNAIAEVIARMENPDRPRLLSTSGLVERLRAVKDAGELALIAKAAELADRAMAKVVPEIRPGDTEESVAWRLEVAMREQGAETLAFGIIVGSGPNGALPHYLAGSRPIQEGEPVVIDMGCQYRGYCSDITRTVCIGDGGERYRKVYDTVLGAQLTAIATVEAGLQGGQADALARDIIVKSGYGDNFGHSLGHGVGLAVHEMPRLGINAQETLQDGMVFTIEPGIYISGWGGVRIEDMVVLEKGRARLLSHAPKEGALGG